MTSRVRFEYAVDTILRLSKLEVAALTQLCEASGDAEVRRLSIPGPGAVLNAARNALHFAETEDEKEFCAVRVSYRQLDTLCKATEWEGPTVGCHEDLRKLLSEAGAESMRLNGDPRAERKAGAS